VVSLAATWSNAWLLKVRKSAAFAHYNSLNSGGNLPLLPCGDSGFPGDYPWRLERSLQRSQEHQRRRHCTAFRALISIPYSYQSPMDFVQVNILGTAHVPGGLPGGRGENLVITSSSEVYGTAQFVPITESHPLVGQSPYAASKIAGEKLAESFSRSYSLPLTVLRPFNTFGPRQSGTSIHPQRHRSSPVSRPCSGWSSGTAP